MYLTINERLIRETSIHLSKRRNNIIHVRGITIERV